MPGDALQVELLLDQIDDHSGQFTADGAYDAAPMYQRATHVPERDQP